MSNENKVIDAVALFTAAKMAPPAKLPELSLDDYVALGISGAETADSRLVEVPFQAQKTLMEYTKKYGFGASQIVTFFIKDILAKFGFEGPVQFKVLDGTFTWVAFQKKVSPKADAAKAAQEKWAEPQTAAQVIARHMDDEVRTVVKEQPLPEKPAITVQTSSAPSNEEEKVAHQSGATSSHFSPFSFYNPFEGVRLTCQRFMAGNRKHENSTTVYSEMNWLKALRSRDVSFFRDRAGHAVEHLLAEMHGNDDTDPGGNLGAVGWFVEIFAYVKSHDPFFYACIQGKHHIDDAEAEKNYAEPNLGVLEGEAVNE